MWAWASANPFYFTCLVALGIVMGSITTWKIIDPIMGRVGGQTAPEEVLDPDVEEEEEEEEEEPPVIEAPKKAWYSRLRE